MKSIVSTLMAASLLIPAAFAGECEKAKDGSEKAKETAAASAHEDQVLAGEKKKKKDKDKDEEEEALLAGDKKKKKDKDEDKEEETLFA